jgi:hypothetical protein
MLCVLDVFVDGVGLLIPEIANVDKHLLRKVVVGDHLVF